MVGDAVASGVPWTDDTREVAALDEARGAFIRYFHGSMKERNWLPWDDLPLEEIRERGHLLGDDTVTIIQGLLGLEDAANDIVADALDLVHRRHALRNLYLAWGIEELKHAETWELLLVRAGRRTEGEVEAYRAAVTATRWRMWDDDPALASPLGIVCHGLVREQAIYALYAALQGHIRREYGLPPEPTADERERGLALGAVGAVQLVATDELAHRETFLDLVRIYRRHMPQETLAVLLRALTDFRHPGLLRLPDHVQLTEALERTGLHTPQTWSTDVQDVILHALEFADFRALEAAGK